MYSIIRVSSDPLVTAVNDQPQCFLVENSISENLIRHWGSRESWGNIGVSPSQKSEGAEFKLTFGATLSDFVSFTPHLLNCVLVSEKVKGLLDLHNLKNLILLEATLLEGSFKHTYYLVHCWQIESEVVDFSNTVLAEDGLVFVLKDHEDLKNIKAKYPFCDFKKTVLNETFDTSIDLFKNIDGEIYISSRLLEEFTNNGISGVNILVNKGELSKWPIVTVP